MRIIAGKNRGTKLYTLDGDDITRPTLDRVKESLFNIISGYLEESNVLDLFAGSGALGLEALSRGASEVVFCDNSSKAINIIKNNIEKTKQKEKTKVLYKDFAKAILNLKNENKKFDIIFLDPPYKTDYIVKAIEMIIEGSLLSENGIIIAETDEKDRILKELENKDVMIYDIRKYGRIDIIFLKRKG
jgi:16S rRNA (guanine(966)-N(2))-methyltransferase RsmD